MGVLKLEGLRNLRGELNVKGLKCLRSLELRNMFGLDRVDGLQDVSKLAYFRWISDIRGVEAAVPTAQSHNGTIAGIA